MAVITARRDDTCGACGADITAGERINYNGPGAVSCATCPVQERRPPARKSSSSSRYGRRRGYARPSSQKCEDAPCCGCCSVW